MEENEIMIEEEIDEEEVTDLVPTEDDDGSAKDNSSTKTGLICGGVGLLAGVVACFVAGKIKARRAAKKASVVAKTDSEVIDVDESELNDVDEDDTDEE